MLVTAALSQGTKTAEAAAALTQGAEAAVIAVTRVEVQDPGLLLGHHHLLKQDHHPDHGHLLLLRLVTSLLVEALQGAEVCPDLYLLLSE
jgi:hypothetical protein